MKIKSGLKLPDGKIIVSTMDDCKWDLLCLVDRLFHPYKYEDVEDSIIKISNRLKSRCNNNRQRTSVDIFIADIKALPDDMKEETEFNILNQLALV